MKMLEADSILYKLTGLYIMTITKAKNIYNLFEFMNL